MPGSKELEWRLQGCGQVCPDEVGVPAMPSFAPCSTVKRSETSPAVGNQAGVAAG